MARDTNILDTVTLRISTNPQIETLLEQLVKKGRHGKNTSEAAERLIAQKLDELVKEGSLKEPGSK